MSDNKNPTNTTDTGHVWDGNLRELTNQPPRWWMITLYLSGIFLVVYFILYPSIPTLTGYTKGVLGWTQMKRLQETVQEIEEVRAPFENKLKGMSAAAIIADQELSNYTVRSAKVLFGDRCAGCHGTGGAGNPGFPVLADDDWLFGGDIDTIQASITMGRAGMMPAFKDMLSEQQLSEKDRQITDIQARLEDLRKQAETAKLDTEAKIREREEQLRSEKRRTAGTAIESAATGNLTPWREVVSPHRDVASGGYQQAEFAVEAVHGAFPVYFQQGFDPAANALLRFGEGGIEWYARRRVRDGRRRQFHAQCADCRRSLVHR